MSKIEFLKPIEIEVRKRLKVLTSNDIKSPIETWNETVKKIGSPEILLNAEAFVNSISIEHTGLTKEQYLAHCYRVSALGINFSHQDHQIIGAIGLIHNVYEVSDIKQKKIESKFGVEISDALLNLKVDRSRQWNSAYLKEYYQRLGEGPAYLSTIKVVDKLDNLFMLGLNPDDIIRERYLEEIQNYVIPLASGIDDYLSSYMEDLIIYNKENGHFTKEKFLK